MFSLGESIADSEYINYLLGWCIYMLDNIDDVQMIHNSLLKLKRFRLRDVEKYTTIMKNFHLCDVSQDNGFQRTYKGFYKIRRGSEFCKPYFEYMERHKNDDVKFESIITYLYSKTNKIEPSFSSKMLATINPEMPVWDKNVMSQLSICVPKYYQENRLKRVVEAYSALEKWYLRYMETQNAKDVIKIFDEVFPNISVTNVKKIDLAIWSLGAKE